MIKKQPLMTDDGHMVIYTDGSCLNNGVVGKAIAGYSIFVDDDHEYNIFGRLPNRCSIHEEKDYSPTNNRAELYVNFFRLILF